LQIPSPFDLVSDFEGVTYTAAFFQVNNNVSWFITLRFSCFGLFHGFIRVYVFFNVFVSTLTCNPLLGKLYYTVIHIWQGVVFEF